MLSKGLWNAATWFLFIYSVVFGPIISPPGPEDNRSSLLVLTNCYPIMSTHSRFFQYLNSRYKVVIKHMDYEDPVDIKLFQHLIIFAPRADKFGWNLREKDVINFIDEGGNILIALDPNASSFIWKLVATHFGIQGDDYDHQELMPVQMILDPKTRINASVIPGLGKDNDLPIIYEGSSFYINAEDQSSVLKNVLIPNADTTMPTPTVLEQVISTASKPWQKRIHSFLHKFFPGLIIPRRNKNRILIGALQTSNNSRVIISGSLSIFSNVLFADKVNEAPCGNEAFIKSLTDWVFQQKGLSNVTN